MSFFYGEGDIVSYAPREAYVAGGQLGEPFAPQAKTYTIANSSTDTPANWTITTDGGAA